MRCSLCTVQVDGLLRGAGVPASAEVGRAPRQAAAWLATLVTAILVDVYAEYDRQDAAAACHLIPVQVREFRTNDQQTFIPSLEKQNKTKHWSEP